MTIEEFWEIFIDAFIASLKVLLIAIVFYIILSFFETKLSKHLDKRHKTAPLFGALSGLIPQCGISVVASDLYVKEHITMGTLLAVFLACSDEAIPIMLSDGDKFVLILPLIICKLIIGFAVGYLVDYLYRKNREIVSKHHEHCHHTEEVHIGCCGHEIDNDHTSKWRKHLWHPLLHSLKLFCYVLIINLLFGVLVGWIGEDKIMDFLSANKYLSPLVAVLIGLIPNCASSVIITELFLLGGIGFGAALGGLSVNAGLGVFYLIKQEKNHKKVLVIVSILVLVSILTGYIASFILAFK